MSQNRTLRLDSRDLSHTSLWAETEEYFHNLLAPGFGKVTGADDLIASPDGSYLAFTGTIQVQLNAAPYSRICLLEVASKALTIITQGPHSDRLPQFSPDGRYLSFISDRAKKGVFSPYLLPLRDGVPGDVRSLSSFDGFTEYHYWAPDSSRLLLGVAGLGADKQSADGSGKFNDDTAAALPTWVPEVDSGVQVNQWRSLWIYELRSDRLFQVIRSDINVWDGNWCGLDKLTAVVTDSPGEGAWYYARVVVVDIATGEVSTLLRPAPDFQFSKPVSSPVGKHTAVTQALCSDRSVVAGNIHVIDIQTQTTTVLKTNDVDVTEVSWIDDVNLFFCGLRGLETVFGTINVLTSQVQELFSTASSCGHLYPEATIVSQGPTFAAVFESTTRYPEIAIIQSGHESILLSLSHPGSSWLQTKIGSTHTLSWSAPDGLEIQGLLMLPATGTAPFPLILDVHGGPVWAWQNRWPGIDIWGLYVARGYAVLRANPRGSAGRGQAFIRGVHGDMGGADAKDLLAGIEQLVQDGTGDTRRVGVTGRSYGGTMAAWIITQTDRFAASVPIAACCDWVSQHTTTNIPEFDRIFLQSDPYEAGGAYQLRSPLLSAGKYSTPVSQIAGKEDYCVPASQALQYHRALLEKRVESSLAVYPGEAHGVRSFPAYIDFCVRAVGWFERFMPA